MMFSSLFPSGFTPPVVLSLEFILGLSAVMSGLSGFGFSAVGALCLTLVPPKLGVPLLMSLSAANQIMSLGQLKADMKPLRQWWPDGPGPYLLGGLLGVPIGLAILTSLPTTTLMALFGSFLVLYSTYSLIRRQNAHAPLQGGWLASSGVGMAGGVIGGFTAFPGAMVVVWSGLKGLAKGESRAIVQPYIFVLQILSIALLALQRPQTFNHVFWGLLLITVPVVLPGTLLGVRLYRSLSDINFRRLSFLLLGVSGGGLLLKAISS